MHTNDGQRSRFEMPRANAWATQELDADDLVEVANAAEALEIENDHTRDAVRTDDRGANVVSIATLRAAHQAYSTPPAPAASPSPSMAPVGVAVPAAATAVDDDAYFHPGGHIRSLADATLDGFGWRPEPTIVIRRVRARSRRSWIIAGVVAVALPAALIGFVVMLSGDGVEPPASRLARTHSLASGEKASFTSIGPTSRASRTVVTTQSGPRRSPIGNVPANRRR